MLRFGPEGGPVAIVALPLLEEANRTRAFAATLLRALAARGIGGALPDLPGTGESLVPTAAITLAGLREGFAAAAVRCGDNVHAVALRSGALLDGVAPVRGRWHLSPNDGAATLREWRRIAAAAGRSRGDADPETIAGNAISPTLLVELSAVPALPEAAPLRTVRLVGDDRPADRVVAGPPLWRRAEPGNDPALAATLAEDIAGWIAACEA